MACDHAGFSLKEEIKILLENAGHKEEAKDIVYFRMEEPAAPAVCRWEMLGYPLMSVLGIRSEDLQNN